MSRRKSAMLAIGLIVFIVAGLFIIRTMMSGEFTGRTLGVKLNNANNLGSLSFDLRYDASIMKCTGVKESKLAEGGMLEVNNQEAGRVRIAVISSRGISGSGELVTLNFDPVGTGGGGKLELSSVEAYAATTLVDIRTETMAGRYSSQDKSFESPEISLLN